MKDEAPCGPSHNVALGTVFVALPPVPEDLDALRRMFWAGTRGLLPFSEAALLYPGPQGMLSEAPSQSFFPGEKPTGGWEFLLYLLPPGFPSP